MSADAWVNCPHCNTTNTLATYGEFDTAGGKFFVQLNVVCSKRHGGCGFTDELTVEHPMRLT